MENDFLQYSIDKTKVKCKYCDKILNLGSGFSTGKMIRHMMNVHTSIHIEHEKSNRTEAKGELSYDITFVVDYLH